MLTIRRLYLYGVSLISLMVVTWGLIGLARSAIAGDAIGGDVTQLAGALALIFVGVPVFLLHWWLAQRAARTDDEEQYSRIRALFLYGSLLATLIPIVQNGMALVSRIFFQLFEADTNQLVFGYGQTWGDNLIAIVMNGLIAAYIFRVLRQNWDEETVSDAFRETRRSYRLVWILYGLFLAVFGLQQMLLYFFDYLADSDKTSQAILANGLTLFLVGVPVWFYSWRILQRTLSQPGEQNSLLRLIVLYAVRLVSLLATLSAAGVILYQLFRTLLGEIHFFAPFIENTRDPFSIMIPMGIVWAFFSTILRRENKALPETPPRTGLQRLYTYVLTFVGLSAVFVGLQLLSNTLIVLLPLDNFAEKDSFYGNGLFRNHLAESLAVLAVSLPLWLLNWIPINRAATSKGEMGDQIRRSVIRKGYLYLVLFAGVIGLMASAGLLVYHLVKAALGEPDRDFAQLIIELVSSLVFFGLLLWYHGRLLQADNRIAARNLSEKHSEFPVLIMVSEIGSFSEMMIAALQKEAPDLPVVVHVVDQGAPDEILSSAKAVILPASITAYPLEAIRLWMQNFSGVRFVVPTPIRGWVWVSGNGSSLPGLIQQTAEKVRKLAEGEAISDTRSSPWIWVGYILGGLLGLIGLFILFSGLVNLLY